MFRHTQCHLTVTCTSREGGGGAWAANSSFLATGRVQQWLYRSLRHWMDNYSFISHGQTTNPQNLPSMPADDSHNCNCYIRNAAIVMSGADRQRFRNRAPVISLHCKTSGDVMFCYGVHGARTGAETHRHEYFWKPFRLCDETLQPCSASWTLNLRAQVSRRLWKALRVVLPSHGTLGNYNSRVSHQRSNGRRYSNYSIVRETLPVLQLGEKCLVFYETGTFVTVLTTARYLSLSWIKLTQSTPSNSVSLRTILILSCYLRLGLPPLVTRTVFNGQHTAWSFPLCCALQSRTLSLLRSCCRMLFQKPF